MLLDVPGIEPDKIHLKCWTPLARAVRRGHTEVVRLLLRYKVNPAHRSGRMLLTQMALYQNCGEIFELLIERIAESGLDYWESWYEVFGFSHIFFEGLQMKVLQTFLNTPRFRSERRHDLEAILWLSAGTGRVSAVEELLRYDEVDPNICINGTTLLALAADRHNACRIIPLLLSRQDLDIKRGDCGGAALMTAVEEGDLDVVQALVKASELDVDYRGGGRMDHKMRLRLQRGYNYQDYHLSKKLAFRSHWCSGDYADTRTPLLVAAEDGQEEIFSMICQHPRTDHYVRDGLGRTSLWWASNYNSIGIMWKILACTPDVAQIINVQDDEGWAPLHIVANYGDLPMARLLLGTPGIDVNVATKQGWTPLHMAMVSCNRKLTRLLLGHPGLDTSLRIDNGRTAFDLHRGCECPISSEIAQRIGTCESGQPNTRV